MNEKDSRVILRRDVGEYLKHLRLKSNVIQADVSKYLGLSSSQHVSNFERGISPVSLDLVKRIIKLYNANPVTVARNISAMQKRHIERIFAVDEQVR